jgi:hypothetical protein
MLSKFLLHFTPIHHYSRWSKILLHITPPYSQIEIEIEIEIIGLVLFEYYLTLLTTRYY